MNNEIMTVDQHVLRIRLFDAQVASLSSEWFETSRFAKCNLHASAIEPTATVQIMGRNDVSQPLNTVDGPILFTLTSAVLMGTDSSRPRFLKAKKTSAAGAVPTTLILEGSDGD